MSSDLRPLLLDDHGLQQAVAAALTEFTTVTGIDVQRELQFKGPELSREVAGHVYRILMEALTNVARHAKAHTVDVRLTTSEESTELKVSDDGEGFDPEALPLEQRFGLLGMRERAEIMGGSFSLTSSLYGGTTLHVSIPRRRSRAQGDHEPHTGSGRDG
jgi:signal transduction histidine kinase